MPATNTVRSDPTAEMAEYASFGFAARVYIAMILDCVLENGAWRDRWRPVINPKVADRALANMAMQRELRDRLLRFWETGQGDAEFTPLVMTSSWDLAMADVNGFAPYRFLCERLYGANVRPLLPAAFAAAAMMPQHPVEARLALLRSLDSDAVAACNQPIRPTFIPSGDALQNSGVDEPMRRPG